MWLVVDAASATVSPAETEALGRAGYQAPFPFQFRTALIQRGAIGWKPQEAPRRMRVQTSETLIRRCIAAPRGDASVDELFQCEQRSAASSVICGVPTCVLQRLCSEGSGVN